MSKVKEIQIRCDHCNEWMPSPIMFGDDESFNTSKLIGNVVQCPSCGETTSCNKENMRMRTENGGFVGFKT